MVSSATSRKGKVRVGKERHIEGWEDRKESGTREHPGALHFLKRRNPCVSTEEGGGRRAGKAFATIMSKGACRATVPEGRKRIHTPFLDIARKKKGPPTQQSRVWEKRPIRQN